MREFTRPPQDRLRRRSPQAHPTLADDADRAGAGTGECRGTAAVHLGHPARRVDLVAEHQQRPQSGGLGLRGHRDRRSQIGRAVRAGDHARTHRTGQHHRQSRAAHQREQVGGFLQRVRALADHHTVRRLRGGGERLDTLHQLQHVGQRHRTARHGERVDRGDFDVRRQCHSRQQFGGTAGRAKTAGLVGAAGDRSAAGNQCHSAHAKPCRFVPEHAAMRLPGLLKRPELTRQAGLVKGNGQECLPDEAPAWNSCYFTLPGGPGAQPAFCTA